MTNESEIGLQLLDILGCTVTLMVSYEQREHKIGVHWNGANLVI